MAAEIEFSAHSEVGALGLGETTRSSSDWLAPLPDIPPFPFQTSMEKPPLAVSPYFESTTSELPVEQPTVPDAAVPCGGGASKPAKRMRGTAGVGALRPGRGTCENRNPNIGPGTKFGRRSPRLGLGSPVRLRASRSSQAEKAQLLTKPTQHSFQSQAAAAAAPATPAAEVPVDAVSQVIASMSQLAISQVETSNVQNVEEYVHDICNLLFRNETRFLARADYMETIQTDITGEDRAMLIDRVVKVHARFCLRPETLHLTVNLIDRYLTKMPIIKQRLQLVGVVAMFIASKSEETSIEETAIEEIQSEISPPEFQSRRSHRPPSPRDWVWIYVWIVGNACTENDILVMECTMLSVLSFQIVVPTAANFFDVFEKANDCNAVHLLLARYILELGLLDLRSLQYKPSQMAAAALLLSNRVIRTIVWPANMVQQTRHTEQSLGSCAAVLRELYEADQAGASQLRAVFEKSTAALHAAANIAG